MNLTTQKILACKLLGCSKKRVRFDPERLDEIKESITKADIGSLIKDKAIYKVASFGISKSRARKRMLQKRKGNRKGFGSRKGSDTARLPSKDEWMNKIRAQRDLMHRLRSKKIISDDVYKMLYKKSQSGFFRSKRHIKLYLEEHELANKR
jgi:large subunit ribosomal protein L19e